ncbi:MAG TPA: bifunctional oligoribonuclease/PAP phosphatase NrnA [Clostridia bacterium]|nr:bifunctional oligoribonuclease/PAP phosphatase NrnA [Clostridia bacterium]
MLDRIAEEIKASRCVAIIPHVTADGDALGSSFALALVLTGMGKKADVLLEESVPLVYRFLPGAEFSYVYAAEPADVEESNGMRESGEKRYDLVMALDCGDIERLGSRRKVFDSCIKTVNIDHHQTNTGFARLNHTNTASSATGEIIYELTGALGLKPGKDAATSLYAAIATDTGGFRYSNTTPRTHEIAAELIKLGVDVADVSQRVFDITSYGKVKLMGAAIRNLELFEDGKLAIMAVTNEMIKNSAAREEDSDGIINVARNIRGVEAAAMLRQLDNGEIKVNLRSNNYIDVAVIASRHKGGGHKRAAGFTETGVLERVKENVINDLKDAL